MSIKNTIIGKIVKNAKMNWDQMPAEEAEQALGEIESAKQASDTVTYGSEIKAIDGIAQAIKLTEEERTELIEETYSKERISEQLALKIKNRIEEDGKENTIIGILAEIHNGWVKSNANKFQARPKDYQFVDLRLLSYNEVELDLIFLQPILEACQIDIDNEKLKNTFLQIQLKYIQEQGITSHDALVERLMRGSDFYPTLSGLKTKKGFDNEQSEAIDDLLKNKEIASNMAAQIEAEICKLRTDLHSHLNGVLPEDELIKLAKDCGIDISSLNINLTMPENGSIFATMQKRYQTRQRVIKSIFTNGYGTKFIMAVAKDYEKHGIYYTELTTDPEVLEYINNGNIDIDEIEKETGVKIRFLLRIHRNNSENDNREEFCSENIQKIMKNGKYIKGIDIMGDENHGSEIATQKEFLKTLVNYSIDNPDFLIRIHSGENKTDPDGIKNALETIKLYCKNLGIHRYPRIRIGHAIHGVDNESIKLMKEMGVAIELNLASNLSLRNIDSVQDIDLLRTIKLCKENDITIFLGTDGYGMYSSSPEEQTNLAKQASCDLIQVFQNETIYLSMETERERTFEEGKVRRVLLEPKDEKKRARKKLKEQFEILGIENIDSQEALINGKRFNGKIPIVIAGSSFKTRAEGNLEQYKEIALAFQVLVNVINSSKAYIVTGGTNCGPERFMHEAVQKRNRKQKKQLDCIGVYIDYLGRDDDSNAQKDFSKIEKGTVTHAVIVSAFTGWGKFPHKLLQIANNKYNNQKGTKGGIIFVGGGNTVKEQIKLAIDGDKESEIEPISTFMYSGFGESKKFMEMNSESKKVCGFENAETLIRKIQECFGTEIFIKGFNIDNIQDYINEAQKMVNLDYQVFENALIDEGKYTREQFEKVKKRLESKFKFSRVYSSKYKDEILEDALGWNVNDKDLRICLKSYIDYMTQINQPQIPSNFTEGLSHNQIINKGLKIFASIKRSYMNSRVASKGGKDDGDR